MVKIKFCDKCKVVKAEVETDRGVFLCNECDYERLSAINNIDNPVTEEEFYDMINKCVLNETENE